MSAPRAAAIGDRVDERISEESAPKRRAGVEPFPLAVFPKVIQRYVTEGAASIGCAVDFFAVPLLVIAGIAIGASRALRIKRGWHERASFYAAIVGNPGSGKSPSLHRVAAPMYRRQERHKSEFDRAMAEWDAAAATKKGDATPLGKPVLSRVWTSDTTTEKLASILNENPRGVGIARDELTALVRSMNQYRQGKGADREFFLSGWSGAPVAVDRQSRETIIVPHPFLNIVGGVPPEMLIELADERGREDGFVHRLLFSYPDVSPPGAWSEAAISDEAERGWWTAWERLAALQPDTDEHGNPRPKIVSFTAGGKQAWIDFYNAHKAELAAADFAEQLHGPWEKLLNYGGRFPLVLQLLRVVCGEATSEDVDEEGVLGAAATADYFKSHARRVYKCLRVSPEGKRADAAERWIRRRDGQCTPRDLSRACVPGIDTTKAAHGVLQYLVERERGRWEPRRQGGPVFVLGEAATS